MAMGRGFSFTLPELGVSVIAPAKLNLCLRITGKRDDGYHDLISVVIFAHFGDRLTVTPFTHDHIEIIGPFASTLNEAGGDRLIAEALRRLRAEAIDMPPVAIRLAKNIPVGGGLAGGTTDAAALLRLARVLNPEVPQDLLLKIACQLGADGAACLNPMPQIIQGIGQHQTPLKNKFKSLICILAYAGAPASTSDVFNDFQDIISPHPQNIIDLAYKGDISALVAEGNDLELPALSLYPKIGDLLQLMRGCSGFMTPPVMSGSGACCFALFDDQKAAMSMLSLLHGFGFWAVRTHLLT